MFQQRGTHRVKYMHISFQAKKLHVCHCIFINGADSIAGKELGVETRG